MSLIKLIDLNEGKFNFVKIFILFEYKFLFISPEKSKSLKRLYQIVFEQEGKFFVREDKIDNFSEFKKFIH